MVTETQLAEATFDATRVARFLRSPAGSLRVALVNVATGAEFGSLPLANASREELARVMGVVGAMRVRLASAPVVASAEHQAAQAAAQAAAQETPAEWRRRVLGKSVWFRFGPRRVTVVLNGPRGDKSELVARKREAAEAMDAVTRVATGHGGVVLPPRTITKATEEVEIFVTSLPPDAVESFVRGVTGGLGAMGFKVFAEPSEAPPVRVSPPVPAPPPVLFAQRFGAGSVEELRPVAARTSAAYLPLAAFLAAPVSFSRRNYGASRFTWASVDLPDGTSVDVGDPWPGMAWPKAELRAALVALWLRLYDRSAPPSEVLAARKMREEAATAAQARRGAAGKGAKAAMPVAPSARRFGAGEAEPVRPRVVFTRSRFGAGAPEPLRPLPAPPPTTEVQKAASATIGAILETPAQAQQSPDPDVASGGRKWSTYQRAVFEHIRAATNHLVIRAVAGSGKTTVIMHALTLIPRDKRVLVVAFNKTIQKELAAKIPSHLTNVTVTTLAAHGYSVLRHYWRGVELLTEKGDGGDVCDKARDATVFYAALGADEQGLKGAWIRSSKDWRLYYDLLDDVRELITLCECFLAMTPEAIRAVQVDYDKLTHNGSPLQWDWQGRSRIYGPDDVVRWVLSAQRERLREPPANANYGRYAVTREKYLAKYLPIYDRLTDEGRKPFCSFRDMTFVPAATPSMVPPERYDWVIVDEGQDMDAAQAELVIRTLAPNGRLVLVGDEDQSIYRFRGADSTGMTRTSRRVQAVELPLSESYRVPGCVAREARTVVQNFSVPARTLDGSPWPEGTCAKITAGEMANRWRAGDLVISRLNAPLVPMAMLAISQGITPLILGEGNGIAFKVRGLFNRILEARGLTHAAPLDAFQPALLAWRDSELDKIARELREKLRGWEATYDKEKRDFDSGRSKRRPSRFWDRTGGRYYDSNAALDQLLGESTDAAEARLIFAAFWNPQGTGLSQRDGLATIGDIAAVVARLAPTEKAMESLSPEEYKALMASRLVLTSVHRIKGGEAPRVFLLTETFKFAFGRWQKRAPDNIKDQKEEQNLWYVAVTRAKAEMGNPDSGILWYVSDVESFLGRSRDWKVDQG